MNASVSTPNSVLGGSLPPTTTKEAPERKEKAMKNRTEKSDRVPESDQATRLVDATLLGIVYHPELRGKVSDNTARDIRSMLEMLAEKIKQ